MRIRTVFLISVAIGSTAGILALALYSVDQWSAYGSAKDVLAEARQFARVLSVPESMNLERAYINARLVGANIGTAQQFETISALTKRVDNSFLEADRLVSPATRRNLDAIQQSLQLTRERALSNAVKPLNQRGVGNDQQYRSKMFDLQAAATEVATTIQRKITVSDPVAGQATRLALLAWELRDWSGQQTTTLISIVGRLLPMVGEQVETLALYKGRLDQIWLELDAVATQIDRPDINAAVAEVKSTFWDHGGEAFTRWVLPNRGALVSFNVDRYVEEIRPILDTIFLIRDAALAEAWRQGEANVVAAERNVRISALLALLTVCAGGASFWWFDRRVLRAAADITTTIQLLASGERDVDVPMQDRTDELGQMSRAIEVLRANAVRAEEEQCTRAVEKARLYAELAVRNDALARLNDDLQVSAATDALTGLANRKAFGSRLQEMMAEAARGHSFALHYVDLDLFKVVNDSFGHLVGDGLLRAVASRLRECVQAHGRRRAPGRR